MKRTIENSRDEKLSELADAAAAEQVQRPLDQIEVCYVSYEHDFEFTVPVLRGDTSNSVFERLRMAYNEKMRPIREAEVLMHQRAEEVAERLWDQSVHVDTIHELRPLMAEHGFGEWAADDDLLLWAVTYLGDLEERHHPDGSPIE